MEWIVNMKKFTNLPSKKELNATFAYVEGVLYWNVDIFGFIKKGDLVSYKCLYSKYRYIFINDKKYNYARIIWTMFNDECLNKNDRIVHIDGNRFNFKIENLKKLTHAQQMSLLLSNNKANLRGVFFEPRTSKWYSRIKYKGTRYYLGTFWEKEDAYKAYCKKAKELFEELND